MRIVFAGTPDFALPALGALHAAGHRIAGVFTQPDRPAGRGQKLQTSPVGARAELLGFPVFKPERLDAEAQQQLRQLEPEAMVVVAYGLILPSAALEIPPRGCFNIHASLLPRWRGAAPIQRAILAGDRETGVTIMRMDAGLDTGPMLLRGKTPVGVATTSAILHDQLGRLGAELIVKAIAQVARGAQKETPQPAEGATYAKKISKEEARLDWTQPAAQLVRQVNAFNPAPVAWTELEDERVRIYAAHELPSRPRQAPGFVNRVSAEGIEVETGLGSLLIERLQRPGGRVISAVEAARGWKLDGKQFR